MQRYIAAVIILMLSASSAWADWQLLKETREYILYMDPVPTSRVQYLP